MRKPGVFKRSLALLLALAGCASPQKPSSNANTPHVERWAAYYDKELPIDVFMDYDVVVFEPTRHVDFRRLQPKTTVLAYLSIGELPEHSELVEDMRKTRLVLARNPIWNSYIVDARKEQWRTLLLDKQIPAIQAQGFDGVMLDTADSLLDLEEKNPKQYAGMHYALASLIRDIHTRYPTMKIMLNRGFPLLHDVGGDIDYALAESVQSTYDAIGNTHRMTPASAHDPIFETLRLARVRNPQLKIYTLDYWNMNDVKGVQFIYQAQRARGFIPYVASPTLRIMHAEPEHQPSEPMKMRG